MWVRSGVSVVILLLALPPPASAQELDPARLQLARERAIALNLQPDLSAVLWFRYSTGSKAPKHPEYIVNFLLEPRGAAGGANSSYGLRVVMQEATSPILDQVADALEATHGLPIEVAARRVRVRVASIADGDCPAVRESYDAFARQAGPALKLTLDTQDFYHGPYFQIEGYSQAASFSLFVEQENPLFSWAERAYTALAACASR